MNSTKTFTFLIIFILFVCLSSACKNQPNEFITPDLKEEVTIPPTPQQLEFANEVCTCYDLLERSRNFNTITRNFKQCVTSFTEDHPNETKALLVSFEQIKENSALPENYDYGSVLSNKGNIISLINCVSYRNDLTSFKNDVIKQTGKSLSPVKENIQNLEASLYEIKDDDKLASVYYMIGVLYEYDQNTKQARKYYRLSADLNIQNNQLGQMFKELLQHN